MSICICGARTIGGRCHIEQNELRARDEEDGSEEEEDQRDANSQNIIKCTAFSILMSHFAWIGGQKNRSWDLDFRSIEVCIPFTTPFLLLSLSTCKMISWQVSRRPGDTQPRRRWHSLFSQIGFLLRGWQSSQVWEHTHTHTQSIKLLNRKECSMIQSGGLTRYARCNRAKKHMTTALSTISSLSTPLVGKEAQAFPSERELQDSKVTRLEEWMQNIAVVKSPTSTVTRSEKRTVGLIKLYETCRSTDPLIPPWSKVSA